MAEKRAAMSTGIAVTSCSNAMSGPSSDKYTHALLEGPARRMFQLTRRKLIQPIITDACPTDRASGLTLKGGRASTAGACAYAREGSNAMPTPYLVAWLRAGSNERR